MKRIVMTLVIIVILCSVTAATHGRLAAEVLRAGAAAVDVSPTQFPVIRNGGFIEAQDERLVDPLYARSIVLASGNRQIAIVMVDSCMIPLDVCDEAKRLAAEQTKIPRENILIAATHAHSAPSVMDYCLGSRADKTYRAFLPGRIAEAIAQAHSRLVDAQVGWTVIDAGDATNNRRWVTRPDKMLEDPFGNRSVRAMMHPGHENPDYVGPSGPIDPWLSVVSVQDRKGKPIALLANFSMHYFGGHPGISADYFGLFCRLCQEELSPRDSSFVPMMSQGTSGDLWWGDYSRPPRPPQSMEDFTRPLVEQVARAYRQLEHRADADIGMAERRFTLQRRTPDDERLAWARRTVKLFGDQRPRNLPEVYAEQAIYLHENPTAEIVLQAIRIGDIAITAMPNEVYALTGLKVKAQSPLPNTMNIELANGADGYIPPPEQHMLGGYTTWPARTAGLEVKAEPVIVETVLQLLEQISGKSRRTYSEPIGAYARRILASKPITYLRCGELVPDVATDSGPAQRHAHYVGHVAFHLPGVQSPTFGEKYSSRSVHCAGGGIDTAPFTPLSDYSVELWFWNGMGADVRPVTGTLWSYSTDCLTITGTGSTSQGRLSIGPHVGQTQIPARRWNHVVLVRRGDKVSVFLNGAAEPDLHGDLPWSRPEQSVAARIGHGAAPESSWEGRVDEIAIYDRPLTVDEITDHFRQAEVSPATLGIGPQPDSGPLNPTDALAAIQVPPGYSVELVAAEPLVQDPVAIDWGADGRLWVAEMADYPLGMDGQGKPGGRVRYLEDTDGDGRYDKSVLFLEGLTFPNGVLAWRDGVLITAAPEILWARDTDHDGRVDEREVLYTGFLEGNQQLRVNGLRWGLDNWVYCASGAHHVGFGAATQIRAVRLGQTIPLGSRDFRIRPDEGILDPQSGPSQFGRVRGEWGDWFGVQNSMPLWHYVLADHYLRRNTRVAAPDAKKLLRPVQPRVYPARAPEKRYHGFDHVNHYTSACGPSLYGDELLFPREDGVQHAFTCEPFHNVVQHHVIKDDGASFVGDRADDRSPLDFFAAADRWCRPVMTRTGPDGALYVVDMYRYMIEHPEFLPAEGQAELKPFYRYGDDRGRIYRIIRTGAPTPTMVRCDSVTPAQMVEHLTSTNVVVRDLAQRLLLERQALQAVPQLERMVLEHPLPLARLHALSTLDGLQRVSATCLRQALHDTHPAVRRQAIRIAETVSPLEADVISALQQLVHDGDAKVRLQLACSLGNWPENWAGNSLAEMVLNGPVDAYLSTAILSSLMAHYDVVAGKMTDRSTVIDTPINRGIWIMAPDHRSSFAKYLHAILATAPERAPDSHWFELARGLQAWDEHNVSLDGLCKANADPLSHELMRLQSWSEHAATLALNSQAPEANRAAAIELLGRFQMYRSSDTDALRQLLGPTNPPALERAAIVRLLAMNDISLVDAILDQWPGFSADTRAFVFDRIAARGQAIERFMDRLRQGTVRATDIDLARRGVLLRSSNAQIASEAKLLFVDTVDPNRQRVIEQYQSALSLAGDPQKGAPLFQQHCATCHVAQGEQQVSLGPDLRSLTDRSGPALLVSILDPSRIVEPKYVGYNVSLESGEVLFGVVANETGNSIQIRLVDGRERSVVRENIEALQSSGKSFMPDGLDAQLNPQQLADVMAFVQGLGKGE